MSKNFDRELLADVAEKLIHHLKNRTDVQNIDLMNLSGFCRNCLSKWYVSAAEKKNISIDLLKQIIEARVDEIMELVVLQSDYVKKLNTIVKPNLIIIGGGSQLLHNNYTLSINKLVSELKIFNENDSNDCKAGFDYHQSDESFLIKTKRKVTKSGFFETFFNIFSK